eukprot:1736111-Ditylum_brightwellii.AAC.1
MECHKDAGDSLQQLIDDVGIPECMVMDSATEFVGKNTNFVHETRKMRMNLCYSKQGQHKQNHHAECKIGILSTQWKHHMKKKGVPRCLWDLDMVYVKELSTHIVRGHIKRTEKLNVSDNPKCLGRWVGILHNVGFDLCYWIVTTSDKLVSKTSVQHIIREGVMEEGVNRQTNEFNSKLTTRLDDSNFTVEHKGYLVGMDLDKIGQQRHSFP